MNFSLKKETVRHEQSSLSRNPLGDFTLEKEETNIAEFIPWILCIDSPLREGCFADITCPKLASDRKAKEEKEREREREREWERENLVRPMFY